MTTSLLEGRSVVKHVSMPLNLARALERQAALEDRPISRVIRRALIQYLTAQEPGDDGQNKEPD